MQKSLLINLALFVVAGLLAALIWLEPGLEQPSATPPLTAIDPTNVNTLQLQRLDKPPINFERNSQGHWHMRSPFNLPANQFHINALLKLLTERNYQLLTDNVDQVTAQLEPPLMEIVFNQQTIQVGDVSALAEGQRYMRWQDKNYLMVDKVMPFIHNEATAFLNLFLLPPDAEVVELQMPDYHLVADKGSWRLQHSAVNAELLDTRADSLNQVLDNWRQAQALSVRAYQQAHEPQGNIRVLLADGEQLTFDILETTPDLMLARSDQAVTYHLAPRQVARLLTLPRLADAISPRSITDTPSTGGE